jgi:putative transposase
MRNVRRCIAPGHPVFITQVCFERRACLEDMQRKLLVLDVLRGLQRELGFRMLAWAILDDHLHLLVEPRDGQFSGLMRSFKLRVVRRLSLAAGERFWQMRFHDHVCRDERDVERHIDYIHYNAVHHCRAPRPCDYPWSSFRTYVEMGIRAEDWAAEAAPKGIERIGRE